MSCSICGQNGHNKRSCPGVLNQDSKEDRDMALWVKFDSVTKDETSNLLKEIIDVKDRVAPKARATYARDNKNNLPIEIRKALALTDGENGDE